MKAKRIKLLPDHDVHNDLEMRPMIGHVVNPLQIDLVLETVFSFCSVNTLKNCRLVSKQWKDVSLKLWRYKAFLCLGERTLPIQRYVRMLQSKYKKHEALQLKKYPYKNFQIESRLREYLKDTAKPVSDIARRVVLSYCKGPLSQFVEFLSKSHSLEDLELEDCDWNHWHVRQQELPALESNVKRLKIVRKESCYYKFEQLNEVLKYFKELESFSLVHRWRYRSRLLRDSLSSIASIRNAAEDGGQRFMALKELQIINLFNTQGVSNEWPYSDSRFPQDNVYSGIITPILVCQFPLEKLAIHVVWDKHSLEAAVHPIYSLLDSYKETLQYLNTSFNFICTEETLNRYLLNRKVMPYVLCMEVLTEVCLSNGLWGLNILSGLDLPYLKKLVVDNSECTEKMSDSKRFQLPFPEAIVYERLGTLEFLDNRKMLGAKTIQAFGKIMPNLVNLTIPLNKFTFETVCECFLGLKTLNILAAQCRYEELDDDSFTGISRGAVSGSTRKSNITDLVHLTDLSITCNTEQQGNAPFTDHSVIYGLLHLPRLHSLSIGFKELSDENMAKLMNHVKGSVNIKVKTPFMPESYCDAEVELTSSMQFKIGFKKDII